MWFKSLLCVGLLLGVMPAAVVAQTTGGTPPTTVTRNPVEGDPGAAKPAMRQRPSTARARAVTRADKQAPGTENGNQPDRAAAGGGAH